VPTYQYACTACDHRFEAVQSFADASLTECPACSGGLRKVFSSVGIVFKGSGFYRTDSRNGSRVDAAPSGSSEKSDSTSGAKSGDSSSSSSTTSSSAGSESGSSGSSSGSSSTGPSTGAAAKAS
jgi:putative FmdB family regulatory protein